MVVVSVEQVCEMLGCKRRRVFQLLSDGTLERAPRYGRQIRIYRASVERALMPRAPERARKRRVKAPVMGLLTLSDVPL
jgi:excisionase family DNA binding protein